MIDAAGSVSIGTTTMTGKLSVKYSSAVTAADVFGIYIDGAQSTANSAANVGVQVGPTYAATAGNTLASFYGGNFYPTNSSSGTVTGMIGVQGSPINGSTGTVASMIGLAAAPTKVGTGPVTTMYGVYSSCQNTNATGAVTNCFGLYLAMPDTTGAITNKWGVYQVDANSKYYFAGNVGIGTTTSIFRPYDCEQCGDGISRQLL